LKVKVQVSVYLSANVQSSTGPADFDPVVDDAKECLAREWLGGTMGRPVNRSYMKSRLLWRVAIRRCYSSGTYTLLECITRLTVSSQFVASCARVHNAGALVATDVPDTFNSSAILALASRSAATAGFQLGCSVEALIVHAGVQTTETAHRASLKTSRTQGT